jgi:hypothetical protein
MRHKQSVHEGKRFPCAICGKEFSQSGDLKRHADAVHHAGVRLQAAPTLGPSTATPDIIASAAAAAAVSVDGFRVSTLDELLQHPNMMLQQPKIEIPNSMAIMEVASNNMQTPSMPLSQMSPPVGVS